MEAAAPHTAASGSDVLFVQGHLLPGEWVEWVGRPDPGKHVTRFLPKAARARRTYFAVTNRRVLVIESRRRGDSVAAGPIEAIAKISTSERNVQFGVPSTGSWSFAKAGIDLSVRAQAITGVTFFDIEDPQSVAALVERLRDAA